MLSSKVFCRRFLALCGAGSLLIMSACTNGEESNAVSSSTQPSTRAIQSAPQKTDPTVSAKSADAAWVDAADVFSAASPGDYDVAENPRQLAERTDWVIRGIVGRPNSSREFSTAAQPNDPVYRTIGFELTAWRTIAGKIDLPLGGTPLVIELVAPEDSEGLSDEVLQRLPESSEVLIFGDDFTVPDRATTSVRNSRQGVIYVASHQQGFIVQLDGSLLSLADGSSDFLTSQLGLTTLDEIVEWLADGTERPR